MRVAVITPHYREPREWFQQCLDSVRDQTYPCTHIIVNDGADRGVENSDRVQVFDLPVSHNDVGDAARSIGSVSAIVQGFDAIAWLDGDNWYEPEHIESLVDLHKKTGAAIVTSNRTLNHFDGRVLGPCPESDGVNFHDTSTYLVTRAGFRIVAEWFLMDPELHPGGDRIIWRRVKELGISHAHSGLATLRYRTPYRVHYEYYGFDVPPGAKGNVTV